MQLSPNFKPIQQFSATRAIAKYSISHENVGIIMHVLRNQLYSNKILAVIREYLTNAADAHLNNKIKDAIKVKLPTAIDPTFTIRDFGKGLSPKEMEEVYIKLGTSTKRASNKFTGCLGLGSKAGFAYTDSFSIKSYYSGTKACYLAFIDETLEGRLLTVSKEKTKEQGIEIIIPVKEDDISEFKAELEYFLAGFNFPISCNLELRKLNVRDGSVIMGGVTYPYNSPEGLNSYVLHAEVGALDMTASRESLEYTEKTTKELSKLIKDKEERLFTPVQKKIDQCKTWLEAYQYLRKWELRNNKKYRHLAHPSFKFNGHDLEIKDYDSFRTINVGPFATTEYEDSVGQFSVGSYTTWRDIIDKLKPEEPVFIYKGVYTGEFSEEEKDQILAHLQTICLNKYPHLRILIPNRGKPFEQYPFLDSNIFQDLPIEYSNGLASDADNPNLAPKASVTKVLKRKKATKKEVLESICYRFQSGWRKGKPEAIDNSIEAIYVTEAFLNGKYAQQKLVIEEMKILRKLGKLPTVYVTKKPVENWKSWTQFKQDLLKAHGMDEAVCFSVSDYDFKKMHEIALHDKSPKTFRDWARNHQKAKTRATKNLIKYGLAEHEIRRIAESLPKKCSLFETYPLLKHVGFYRLDEPDALFQYIELIDNA